MRTLIVAAAISAGLAFPVVAQTVVNPPTGSCQNLTGPITSTGCATAIASQTGTGTTFVVQTSPDIVSPQIGAADSATPAANTVTTQGVAAGTSNTAGQNVTFAGSRGRGTGAGGSYIFQTAPAGTAGAGQNALVTALTIDANAVPGVTASGPLSGASVSATGTTPVGNGIYQASASTLGLSANGVGRYIVGSGGLTATGTNGPAIGEASVSATVPGLFPNKNDLTTGIGAQASGNMSAIVGGVEQQRWSASGPSFLGTIPTVTGTGTPTIVTGSTDTAGEVTGGTLATSIVVTFSSVKTNAPFCTVTEQTQLAAFAYTISTSAITITQTATTGAKVDYHCFQH